MTTPTSHTAKHSFRTFLILWFTQSFSSFGTILALFAIDIWLVQSLFPAESQKAELGLAFAAIQLAVALPGVLGAPFAGSWADRHNRRHIMLAADLLNGALCGVLLLFLAVGQLSVPGLVVFIGLVTLVGLFHSSAFDTSYVHLVSEAQLPRANSMMQTMQTLAQLFAPGAAAALMSLPALMRQISGSNPIGQWLARLHDGFGLTIAIDLLSYWLSALILWRLRKRSTTAENVKSWRTS